MARVRERRFRALVDELLPKVRRLNPAMLDDQVLELAESMAELRLLDEEIGEPPIAKPPISKESYGAGSIVTPCARKHGLDC